MAKPTVEVGILGLGRIGASFGLALKRYNASKDARQTFVITGCDDNTAHADKAKAMGAVDSVARSVYETSRDKAIIIIALPYSSVQPAYREIAGAARDGAVIIDTSPLKLPSLAWAEKGLNDRGRGAHMVGATMILNPAYLFDGLDNLDNAHADLFDKGAMLIAPNAKSVPEAIELVSDLAEIIGTKARYADPDEHDGWVAATEGLPVLLGLAAFWSLTKDQGWSDAQKQGNPALGRLIHHLYDTHPDDLRDLLLNNRANLIAKLDKFTQTLGTLREILATNDSAALEEALIETTDAAHLWVTNRKENKWKDDPRSPQVDTSNLLISNMFGSLIGKRMKSDKNGSDR